MAQTKDMRNARVVSARELYQRAARKFGIAIVPLGGMRGDGASSAA
jgi:hypothetical protein